MKKEPDITCKQEMEKPNTYCKSRQCYNVSFYMQNLAMAHKIISSSIWM